MVFLSGGDGPFFYDEQLLNITWSPQVMDLAKGFGENLLPRLWLSYPFRVVVKVLSTFGFGWGIIEKIIWLAALCIGSFGIYRLARRYVSSVSACLSVLIYLCNTYALLLFGGGQLGVALAYAFAPSVLLGFMELIDQQGEPTGERSIICGLLYALLIIFDLRLAYLIIGAAILYFVVHMFRQSENLNVKKSKNADVFRKIVSVFVIPGIVAVSLHLFWILPILLGGGGVAGLGGEYTGPGMLKFLSVADFSHTVSLLHPNWPENLFGKVYFLQPEFLVIPLVAFSALIFVRQEKDRKDILYFALLGLIGAFFAKGVNNPFGGIFNWCFIHIPGFVMFRDPTKFYLFIAIGYAVLIPYVLEKLGGILKKYRWILITVWVVFWCFSIRPIFLGQLKGNFRPQAIPREYVRLKDMLAADMTPSRTLWMPSREKFVYDSDIHPSLSASDLFTDASISGLIRMATSSSFIDTISDAGVRYVIVPMDAEGTMFMSDYKADPKLHQDMTSALQKTSLNQDTAYRDVAVFENARYTFHEAVMTNIGKQTYWADVGLIIDGGSFALIMLFVIRKSKKERRRS